MTSWMWKSKTWIISNLENEYSASSVTKIFTEVQKHVQTQFTVLCS